MWPSGIGGGALDMPVASIGALYSAMWCTAERMEYVQQEVTGGRIGEVSEDPFSAYHLVGH